MTDFDPQIPQKSEPAKSDEPAEKKTSPLAWRKQIFCLPTKIAIALVEIIYRRGVGRLLPKVCIYEPSCSQYMIDALTEYGFFGGIARGVWRICRCHPFAKGGYDPVKKR